MSPYLNIDQAFKELVVDLRIYPHNFLVLNPPSKFRVSYIAIVFIGADCPFLHSYSYMLYKFMNVR